MKRIFLLMILAVCATRAADLPLELTADVPAAVQAVSPVAVNLSIRNVGTVPFVLEDSPRERLVRIEVRKASDRQIVHKGFACAGAVPEGEKTVRPTTIGAGEALQFSIVIANRWSETAELLQPLFTEAGSYLVSFAYPVTVQTGAVREAVEIRSTERRVEVRPSDPTGRAVAATPAQNKFLAWTLEPRAGLAVAEDADLASWESELRTALASAPDSASASAQKFALALILFDRSNRPGAGSVSKLRDEASKLAEAAAQPGFARQRDALKLNSQIRRIAK